MTYLGSVAVDHVEMPIVAMELSGGMLHLTTRVVGPTPAMDGASAVRGSDGLLVVVGGPHVALRPLKRGQSFTFRLHINVMAVECPEPARITDTRPAA